MIFQNSCDIFAGMGMMEIPVGMRAPNLHKQNE
jgi:hypothetical protein